MNDELAKLAEVFGSRSPELATLPIVSGFDGFVDEMISVVEERTDLSHWTPVPTIARMAEHMNAAAGRSSLREIIVHDMAAGGCTVNLSDGTATLGIPMHVFATMGEPIHSAFQSLLQKCASYRSWGATPGRTLALEFSDGKYMLSAITPTFDFTPEHLDKMLADGYYLQCCRDASMLVLTDWSMFPHMTACWKKLNAEVFSKLPRRLPLYIDLVDPSSRTITDIDEMLHTVTELEENVETILGLNGVEANVVARVLGIPTVTDSLEDIATQAAEILENLQINAVSIHCVKTAALADATGSYAVSGPYCAKPKKSTGAGDRFNAGFCAGTLLKLSPRERLLVGCACSGFFVREARSATAKELAEFIQKWSRSEV